MLTVDLMEKAIIEYLDGRRILTREGIFTVYGVFIGEKSRRFGRPKTVLYIYVTEFSDVLEFDLFETLTLIGDQNES